MKKFFKKNQVIVTSLMIMILVAGYLNFTADRVKEKADMVDGELVDVDAVPEEDLSMVMDSTAMEPEADVGNVDEIGEAVLTSTTTAAAANFSSAAKLSREQTRSKSMESLQKVIDNENVEANVRQQAADELMMMTEMAEKELAAETMLEAGGFSNSVVSMNGESVDVVICLESLTEVQKARVEDIIMRKTGCEPEQIVITTLKASE